MTKVGMVRLLYVTIVLVIFPVNFGGLTLGARAEPTCLSRFDHDFKVVQKLAELEQAQKELTAKLERLSVKDDSSGRCPNGWTRYEKSCYNFLDNIEMTWHQAVQHCASFYGGHLANIETYEEQIFLKDSVKKLKNSVGSRKSFWIGATDTDQEGTWVWQPSGELVSAGGVRWYPGEPSGSTSQNCGCLWGDSDYTFHDNICNYKGFIICEKQVGSGGK